MEVDKVDCQVKCVLWASVLPLLGKVPQLKWAVRCQGRMRRCRDIGWQRIWQWQCPDVGGYGCLGSGLDAAATGGADRVPQMQWALEMP